MAKHLLGCVTAKIPNHVTGNTTSIDLLAHKNSTNADSGRRTVWNEMIRTGAISRCFRTPHQTRFPALQLPPLREYENRVVGVQRLSVPKNHF